MIVDSSAIVAIVLDEVEGPGIAATIINADVARVSSTTWFETTLVIDRKKDAVLSRKFGRLVNRLGLEVVPFNRNQAEIARTAFNRFGKGMGHKAQLNFGDCMAYALAKSMGEALLFKGKDFTHTDIEPALKPPSP